MPIFLDACAIAKRYLQEGRSSQTMRWIISRPRNWGGLIVSSFVEIEVASAIAKAARSTPRWQQDEMVRAVPRTVGSFVSEYRSGAFSTIDLTPEVLKAGVEELTSNPLHEIGAGDAIHLVTALAFSAANPADPLVFVTADQGLYEAAKHHGLRVYNPNFESSERLAEQLAAV
jgi:predicted nucleic acid-binding protein